MNVIKSKKGFLLATYCFILLFAILQFDAIKGSVLAFINICSPFFLGFTIAFILNKPTEFFYKHLSKGIRNSGLAKSLAITASYISFLLLLVGLFLFIVPQFISNIDMFFSSLDIYMNNFNVWITNVLAEFPIESFDLTPILSDLSALLQNAVQSLLSIIGNSIPQLVLFTSSIISSLFTLIIAFVVSINLLAGKDTFLNQAKRLCIVYLPEAWSKKVLHVSRVSAVTFNNYLVAQITEAFILGLLCYAGMNIFRFEYSILISTVVAITALIPIVGAYAGAIIAFVLLAMLSPTKAVMFIVYFIILQQLEGNIIYPRVVGSSIGLPGVWVLFAVTVGGGLLGIVGMLIGVPVMSIIYTLIKEDVNAKYQN